MTGLLFSGRRNCCYNLKLHHYYALRITPSKLEEKKSKILISVIYERSNQIINFVSLSASFHPQVQGNHLWEDVNGFCGERGRSSWERGALFNEHKGFGEARHTFSQTHSCVKDGAWALLALGSVVLLNDCHS